MLALHLCISLLLAFASLAGEGAVAAFAQTQDATPTAGIPENPAADSVSARNQQQVMDTLRRLEKKYGRDAVLLSGYALNLAVRHGAILEAETKIHGFDEYNGQRFLSVHLASGIVFNDNDYNASQRPMRVWTNIIEPSLRQLSEDFRLPAPGVHFRVTYAHKGYKDEFDLRDHLPDGRGDEETAQFYVFGADVTELLAKRLSSQDLAHRATILVNGAPTKLSLEPTPEPKRLQPPSEL